VYDHICNTRNALQPYIWHKCHDNGRGWRAILRWKLLDLNIDNKSLATNLDLINEFRDKTRTRDEACKVRETMRYNTNVQPRAFHQGDLVWILRSDARKTDEKFSVKWGGPFYIQNEGKNGVYKL